MKGIYVILFGLIVFNSILVFTNAIGVFDYGGRLFYGENVSDIAGVNTTQNITATTFFNFINPLAAGTTLVILGATIALAILVHSPVPIGIGASCAVFVGIWIQTYDTLSQFPINSYLLGLGTLGMFFIFIMDVISAMKGRQYA